MRQIAASIPLSVLVSTITTGGLLLARPRKKIGYCKGARGAFHTILPFIADRYDIELTPCQDADYIIYNGIGDHVLKYPGVRISITGENVSPNFAVADYALAFDKMTFGDRYLWFPLMRSSGNYAALTRPRPDIDDIIAQKSAFCSYVMSNTTDSAPERSQIFDALTTYKRVNSGGRWRNNVGGRVPDKLAFQSKHKFAIAFENSSTPGYLTEKFADAAAANTIPIYWGDPDIETIINPAAFINCHAFDSLDDVVARVRQIDQDDGLYRTMLAAPWFRDGIEPLSLTNETIRSFLNNIFDGEVQQAYRRNRGRWGKKMEQRLYDKSYRPHVQSFILLREFWRSIFLPAD